MEDDFRGEGLATVAIGNPSHRFSHPLKIEQASDSSDGVDSISSLPDDILHRILSFFPTNFTIRTSVLSKRWRNVWSESPHLSFDHHGISSKSINETLNNYSAIKITSFHLLTSLLNKIHFVNSWIEFAISHGAVNLSLEFRDSRVRDYKFPDFFYTNSSVKQLLINVGPVELIPSCNVTWTSLKYLSLSCCELSDESFPKILSVCPILETLRLHNYNSVKCLDLSQLLHLRRLDIDCCNTIREPMKIMAPHIQYLRLRGQCTLLDVSSLIEANVDSSSVNYFFHSISYHEAEPLKLVMVQAMLEKLQNVDKLTLGVEFLRWDCVNSYLKKQCWRLIDEVFPTSWKYKVVKPKVMASFMELLLANTRTLETLVVQLGSCIDRSRFEELFQIAITLSQNNKVSILLKRSGG